MATPDGVPQGAHNPAGMASPQQQQPPAGPRREQAAHLGSALAALASRLRARRTLRRILVANNGMAATKFISSVRQWALAQGVRDELSVVAMATPDDLASNQEYIRMADHFVEVREGGHTRTATSTPPGLLLSRRCRRLQSQPSNH